MQAIDILRCSKVIRYFASGKIKFRYVLQNMHIIKEVTGILDVVYKTTLTLQKKECTLSDLYACWLKMKLKLRNYQRTHLSTNLVTALEDELEKREHSILKNRSMLSAVYLDRRFTKQLTENETLIAKDTILKVWERMKTLKEYDSHNLSANSGLDEPKNTSNEMLEELINSTEQRATSATSASSLNPRAGSEWLAEKTKLMLHFDEFEKMDRPDIEKTALKQWMEYKDKFPELSLLASIFHSIPPSQASVERSFSALAITFNARRCKLSQSVLEQLMLIKINEELADNIFKGDIQKLKNEIVP